MEWPAHLPIVGGGGVTADHLSRMEKPIEEKEG